jgi:hypothetical protein
MATAGEFAIWVGIVATVVGLLGGFAGGIWVAATKATAIDAHSKAISDINDRCNRHKAEILAEIEAKICATVRSSIKEMVLESKIRQGESDKNVALLVQSTAAMQKDIEAIFRRLSRREEDEAPYLVERRHPLEAS